MTNAPTLARPEPAARAVTADATAMDSAARGPLLMLLGSGLVWLVVSGVLALISAIQLYAPHFLTDCSFLTYGRVDAMRESAFIYGWAGNAGLAIALWILGRVGGNPLRALNWIFVGGVFWNLALTAGLIGIGVGDMTTFAWGQLPRYVQPILVVAYAAIAVSGVLAWSGRRTETMYASQWYAAAALFLFPWLSTAAQVVLLWSPSRGVAQTIAATWYAQGVWSLWLAPIALAAAYYVIPKLSGRSMPTYEFAPLAFWVLLFLGAWTGGRHLVGGPVPAWIVTMAVVAAVLLLFHYLIVGLNLRIAFGATGTSLKLVRFGVVAYLIAGLFDAVTSFRGAAEQTQFTYVSVAAEQLALYGGISMIFFGAIYYMVPRLTGTSWASTGLTMGHQVVVTFGVILLVVTLTVAGLNQGVDLMNAKATFTDIFEQSKLTLVAVSVAQLILLGANLLFVVNFFQTITCTVVSDVVALNPLQQEASAS